MLDDRRAIENLIEAHGWKRIKRDLKGGFLFIHLDDGSCFDTIQMRVMVAQSIEAAT